MVEKRYFLEMMKGIQEQFCFVNLGMNNKRKGR